VLRNDFSGLTSTAGDLQEKDAVILPAWRLGRGDLRVMGCCIMLQEYNTGYGNSMDNGCCYCAGAIV
jgi:hypothetical protein